MSTSVYFAQPYSIDATGFYFSSLEEYKAKAASHTDMHGFPVEEYELQFIDGDNHRLFNALGICQATLTQWFSEFAEFETEDDDYWKAVYLAENGYAIEDVLARLDDLMLWHGSAVDYARELVEDCYDIPEPLRFYIDYDALARDMRLNGEINVLETEQGAVLVLGC
ncbi:MAG: hypothetical protein C0606_03485 [Hyphomicrobiales bacterium]|nr:MAG: hypothetical protein C0606_03485 [Hyphomicrobiales bacterium]